VRHSEKSINNKFWCLYWTKVESINKKIVATTALLTAFAFAAIMGGVLASQPFTVLSADTSTKTTTTDGSCGMMADLGMGMKHGHEGGGGLGQVQVSEEYEQKVISIAENDTDVQNLLAEGYNVTSVHPIISTTIDAYGYVTSRATSAILTLQKDTDNKASVWVDGTGGTVTKIVTLSRTVIDKT
jgi:hypothetical protein